MFEKHENENENKDKIMKMIEWRREKELESTIDNMVAAMIQLVAD